MEALIPLTQGYLLGLGRVLALVMVAPVIGGPMVPGRVKIMLALALTTVCAGGSTLPAAPAGLSWLALALLLAKETAVGLGLGFTLVLALAAIQAAGDLLGFQMLFSLGNTFFPLTEEQSSLTGNWFYLLGLMVFLSLDGHHWLIRALAASFRAVPVWSMPGGGGDVAWWLQQSGRLFVLGLQMSLPVLAALVITNLSLGMIAKTMPQLNIFIVGMPVQVWVAFLLILLALPPLLGAEAEVFKGWARETAGWIRQLAP
ncbi:MAG: flagellar biosynthetic protein FliR [candidate division FCPU426 bacterium]